MTEQNTTIEPLKLGDRVSFVADISTKGVLINYGTPAHLMYGMGIRVPLNQLKKV